MIEEMRCNCAFILYNRQLPKERKLMMTVVMMTCTRECSVHVKVESRA